MRDRKSPRSSSIPKADPVLRSCLSDALYDCQLHCARDLETFAIDHDQVHSCGSQKQIGRKSYGSSKTCMGCGRTGHFSSDCLESMDQSVAKKVQYCQRNTYKDQAKAARCVLHELGHELQNESSATDTEDIQAADEFFGDIVDDDEEMQDQEIDDEEEENCYMSEQLYSRLAENCLGPFSPNDKSEDL